MAAQIPAMRAAFSAACLYAHNAGYRLPSFDRFRDWYVAAIREDPNYGHRFARYFHGDQPTAELLYRLSVSYESYMCEEYVNVCLVEALEDRLKCGVVLYDPRADWKLKGDSFVVCRGVVFVINTYWDGVGDRRQIERHREASERQTKINTSTSSHWGKVELGTFTKIDVKRDEQNCELLNGFRLFSRNAIDELLTTICDKSGVPSAGRPKLDMMIASPPAH